MGAVSRAPGQGKAGKARRVTASSVAASPVMAGGASKVTAQCGSAWRCRARYGRQC